MKKKEFDAEWYAKCSARDFGWQGGCESCMLCRDGKCALRLPRVNGCRHYQKAKEKEAADADTEC